MPLSPAMTEVLRHSIETQLDHVYTRTPRAAVTDDPSTTADESTDPWGEQPYEPALAITDLPCHLQQLKSQVMVLPTGLTTVIAPILIVPRTDPINEGDAVSNVLGPLNPDGTRTVLLAGPLPVESVVDLSPGLPGSLARQVQLRLIETI